MSVIQKIRDKYAAISIAVIAISLIAFILMDALSSRNSFLNNEENFLGKVNDKTISSIDFNKKVETQEVYYRNQGQNSEQLRQQIIESVWNTEIISTLLLDEYNKNGIVFTDIDMEDGIYGENAPSQFKDAFKDPNTGQYDPQLARQQLKKILSNSKQTQEKEELLSYINESIVIPGLQNKYVMLLQASSYYPKWLFEKEQADQASLASINYVNIPYSSIPDSSIKITDEEINKYVQSHKDQFKQEKSVSISYVVFDGSPTKEDSLKTFYELAQKKEEFITTNDVPAFFNLNASDESFNDIYIMKSKLNTAAGDSLFSIEKNAVYGPYLDASSYTLAKYIDKKVVPDSAKCRHILISTQAPEGVNPLPDSIAKKRADSIAAIVATGANFAELVTKLSDDPGSKNTAGEYTFSFEASASLAKEFADFIFNNAPGSKSVVKTQFGYHYIEVLEHKNPAEAYKFAFFKKKVISSQETADQTFALATQFSSLATDKKSFEKTVKDKKLTALAAEFKTTDYMLMGVGNARSMIKWAFENQTGSVSTVEQIGDLLIIALISEKKEEGVMSAKTARPMVEPILLNQKKAQQIITKVKNQKDLNSIGSLFKINVEKADSIIFGSQFVNPIGAEPKLIGASFCTSYKSSVSPGIAGTSGVFYIQVLNTSLLPSSGETYEAKRKQAEQNSQMLINGSIESLKKSAVIVDNRIKFY